MESKRADPLQEALPAMVLLGTFIVIMLVIFAGQNTSVEDDTTEADVAAVDEQAGTGDTADVTDVETEPEADGEAVAEAPAEVVDDPGFKTFDTQLVSDGQTLYQVNCAGCHAMDGQGVLGLGKNLVDSEFVDSLNADGFVSFVVAGRQPFDEANSTGMLMPARGGNPGLTDENIYTIYTFLRSLTAEYDGDVIIYADDVGQYDNPQGAPWGEALAMGVEEPVEDNVPDAVEEVVEVPYEPIEFVPLGPDGTMAVTDLPFEAAHVYAVSCSGCHGPDGQGVDNYAVAFTGVDTEAAFSLLTTTSRVTDLDVEAGMVHPVRAEPFTLTDEQISDLVDYLTTLGG